MEALITTRSRSELYHTVTRQRYLGFTNMSRTSSISKRVNCGAVFYGTSCCRAVNLFDVLRENRRSATHARLSHLFSRAHDNCQPPGKTVNSAFDRDYEISLLIIPDSTLFILHSPTSPPTIDPPSIQPPPPWPEHHWSVI